MVMPVMLCALQLQEQHACGHACWRARALLADPRMHAYCVLCAAQLGWPDMRLPILYTMSWPARVPCSEATWPRLDFAKASQLTFKPPDRQKYPSMDLAYSAGRCTAFPPLSDRRSTQGIRTPDSRPLCPVLDQPRPHANSSGHERCTFVVLVTACVHCCHMMAALESPSLACSLQALLRSQQKGSVVCMQPEAALACLRAACRAPEPDLRLHVA